MACATFLGPRQYAEGVEHVLANAVAAVDRGELTWKLPGAVLTNAR